MADEGTRWIVNSEYNSAKRRDQESAQLRNSADRKAADARRLRAYVENDLENSRNRLNAEIDSRFSAERERLINEIDALDESVRLEFGRQNARFRAQIDSVRRDVSAVNENVDRVGERLDALSTQFSNAIDNILSGIRNQRSRARKYIEQMRSILDQISDLNPEKLTPGEFENYTEQLAAAKTDYSNEDYAAAIGVVQTNLPGCAALYSRLVLLNEEFSQLRDRINSQCNTIEERICNLSISENNRVIIMNGDNEVEFDGRVPFWSNGVFDDVVERFNRVKEEALERFIPDMDIDSMRTVLAALTALDNSLGESVLFAHDQYTEYTGVITLAQRIHRLLSEDTWSLVESGFAYDDERRSYTLLYENGAGLNAAFVIMPDREIVGRKRNGCSEYGETKFDFNVFQTEEDGDVTICEITREGILAVFQNDGLSSGKANGTSRIPENDNDRFISNSIAAGDKIVNGRIAAVKNRIGL